MKTFALSLFLAGAAQSVSAATLCAPEEQVIFSCSTGKKLLSVCASKNLGQSTGYLQYRFGPQGNPEMVFPKDKAHPKGKFAAARLTPMLDNGSRDLIIELNFRNGTYNYSVSSEMGSHGVQGGVLVTKGKKLIADVKCEPKTIENAEMNYFEALDAAGLTK